MGTSSLIERAIGRVGSALGRRAGRVPGGFLHMFGGDVIAKHGDEVTMSFLGQNYKTGGGHGFTAQGTGEGFSVFSMSTFGFAGSILTAGTVMAQGYADQGLFGAMSAASWEMSGSMSMIKHGYKSGGSHGINSVRPKGGMVGMIGRGMTSSTLGYMVGSSIGGIPGYFAGMAGAAIGARNPGTLLMGAGALGAGYLAAKGTGAVFKAGYRHQQMRRGIDTAGSLAAFETQGAYTMRERAVQAIHKSHINARSALGQEASLYHRGQVNFASPYRN